jgi:transposase-like protein
MRKTMTTYPEEFKAKIIAQLPPPHNRNIPELARETGIPPDALYGWRGKNQSAAGVAVTKPASGPDRLSSQDKFHLVVESAPSMNSKRGSSAVAGRGLADGDLLTPKAQTVNLRRFGIAEVEYLHRLFLADAHIDALHEHNRREVQQVQAGLDPFRVADQDINAPVHLLQNPIFPF